MNGSLSEILNAGSLSQSGLLPYALRLGMALACGLCIGLERQWRQHNAGLRTCALVSLGSALFIAAAVCLNLDSTRMSAQVVTGVGFLGAGCIMHSGLSVRGLNTAGTLWCSAAVGTIAGLGLGLEAAVGTLFVLLVNVVFRPVDRMLNRHPHSGGEREFKYELTLRCRETTFSTVRSTVHASLEGAGLRVIGLETALQEGAATSTREIALSATVLVPGEGAGLMESMVEQLTQSGDVTEVGWKWVGFE